MRNPRTQPRLEMPDPQSSIERRDLIKQGKRRFVFKSREAEKILRSRVSNRSLIISTPYDFKHQVHMGPEDSISMATTLPAGSSSVKYTA